jgi:hypothetical protein
MNRFLRRLALVTGLLLIATALAGQTTTKIDSTLIGTWASGISQKGGVQFLVAEFRADGQFSRRFWWGDASGLTPSEDLVNGVWEIDTVLGDPVICTHNEVRPVTICNEYRMVDRDHWMLGEIPFHRLTNAELALLKKTNLIPKGTKPDRIQM